MLHTFLRHFVHRVLAFSLTITAACAEAPQDAWLEGDEAPPDPPSDTSAEVLTLTFGTAWVAAAATVLVVSYLGYVVHENADELGKLLAGVLERPPTADEIDAEARAEPAALTRGINRGFYRNHSHGGAWVTTSDLLIFADRLERAREGTSVQFGEAAARHLRSLRLLSSQARNHRDYRDGGCVKARVQGLEPPQVWFEATARYHSPEDVIAAASYASLKAMVKCARFDAEVVAAVQELLPDNPVDFTVDNFIEYGWKSTRVLWAYGEACSHPPALAISRHVNGCQ